MDSFDLSRLTPHDFEEVCKDLFEDILNTPLEIFGEGKDQGVDLRYVAPGEPNIQTIIQCKHRFNSSSSALQRHLEKSELPKVRALRPTRYLLGTSTRLTVSAKDKITQMLSPFVRTSGDIYGLDEIVAELRKRPGLVRRHLRLWLTSSAVLETLLNRDILERSATLAHDIDASMKVYVPNDSFARAWQLLEDKKVCLISGIPGVGKSTLARVLAAAYMAKDYELIEISEDAKEGDRAWDPDKPQFFYYDDFLGQASLDEKLNKNEDNRLLTLLRKVARSPNKRFVLTTREYILAQAKQKYGRISNHNFNPLTCVVNLDDYTPYIRAKILYNHVNHSNLSAEKRTLFAEEDNYVQIIEHDGFSPRLVALSLELAETDENSSPVDSMLANLRSPYRIWQHIVDFDLSEAAVFLLEVLYTFGRNGPIDDVQKAWEVYCANRGVATSRKMFRISLSVLENTMIQTATSTSLTSISFHNPSIVDYLRDHLANDRDAVRQLLLSDMDISRLATLWATAKSPSAVKLKQTMLSWREEVRSILSAELRRSEIPARGRYGTEGSWVRRYTSVIEIATDFDSEDIVEQIMASLPADWIDRDVKSDDLVGFVRAVSRCESTVVKEAFGEDILSNVLESITADTSDWGNITWAIEQLEYLDDSGVEGVWGALNSLRESMNEYAQREVGRCQEGDIALTSVGWEELDSMVQELSSHPDSESVPGYREALAAVEAHKETQRRDRLEARYEQSAGADDDSPEGSDEQIHSLLSLLRDKED